MKFKVTKKAQRPARMDGSCFYCGEKIGDYHKDNCVLVIKNVIVKATIEYEINVPSDWTKETIEFQRNEGSWCSSNIIEELKKVDEKEGCLCRRVEFEYLKDTSNAFLEEK